MKTISKPIYKYTCTSKEEAATVLFQILSFQKFSKISDSLSTIVQSILYAVHPDVRNFFTIAFIQNGYADTIDNLIMTSRNFRHDNMNDWYFTFNHNFSDRNKFQISVDFNKLAGDARTCDILNALPKAGICECVINATLSPEEYLRIKEEMTTSNVADIETNS